jgi:YggT family protein
VIEELIQLANYFVEQLVLIVVVTIILLMVFRWFFLKMNPFGWFAYQIRRITDPMVWPLAQSLPLPNALAIAPLIVVLIALLGGQFLKSMVGGLLLSLGFLMGGVIGGDPLRMMGGLLHAAASALLMLIFMRIILSWIPFAREGRLGWQLHRFTEPVMAPFRNMIPTVGPFDLSPIILFLLLGWVKSAIEGFFLR